MQLVWDMDGTLLDSEEVVPDAFIGAVAELQGPSVDRSMVIATYSLGVPEVIMAHLLGRTLEEGEAEAYYGRLADAQLSPYAGVVVVLDELRYRGHPIVIFTGSSTRAASMLLTSARIKVDLLIGGDQIDRPKPAPDGLRAVAARLNLDPTSMAYIGDAPTDLQAAKAAGVWSVAAGWGHLYNPEEPADITLATPEQALDFLIEPGGRR
jgi:HAD superfamily hydrolase (TIGR01509 family)